MRGQRVRKERREATKQNPAHQVVCIRPSGMSVLPTSHHPRLTLRPCLCVQSDEVTSVAESVGPRGVPCPSHPGKARVEFCPAFWVTASVHRNHGAHVRAVCSTTCDRKRSKI